MGLRDFLRGPWSKRPPQEEERDGLPLSLGQLAQFFNYGGLGYPLFPQTYTAQPQEQPDQTFEGFVQAAYRSNGVVFACMLVRMLLFSEARFQWRQFSQGRPGNLFGNQNLNILENPWPNATTGDLLRRAIQDADLEGNFYATRSGDRIIRLRPDWVTIVAGVQGDPEATGWELDAELIGYLYQPGGRASGRDAVALGADQVAHFAPIPDPIFRFRGMSWLTPIVREIQSDDAASAHKLKFFQNGATPNMIVTLDANIGKQAFEDFVKRFRYEHEGVQNAYKTLFLAGGAEPKVVGADLRQMEFKNVQGAGETRIAAAAGVPPVIVGLSEGLQAATYSNYGQARRRFADGTMRPLWRDFCSSMQTLVPAPPGAELWYDDRDISFLQEDRADAAAIQHLQATTIQTLVNSGFKPETVIAAVQAEDWSPLKHSGLWSVQLQPPQTTVPQLSPAPNGKQPPPKPGGAPATPGSDQGQQPSRWSPVTQAVLDALMHKDE